MEVKKIKWEPAIGWSDVLPDWDSPQTLLLVFGGSHESTSAVPMAELRQAFPQSALVGCSTAGEIMGEHVSHDSLVAAVIRFRTTRLAVAHEFIGTPDNSYVASYELGRRLLRQEPSTRVMFVLSDGVNVNGSAIAAGISDGVCGADVSITGGLAGDNYRFERTWTVVDGEQRENHVSAIALAGPDLCFGAGAGSGWDGFGPERMVTRSDRNVLYELDGRGALRLYQTYLGESGTGLPAGALLFPLSVRIPGAYERDVIRTVISVDPDRGSMTFAGDIPEGSIVRLMSANLDRLVDGAHQAALDTMTESNSASLAIVVSCVGRRLLLGPRAEDEIEAIRHALPHSAKLIGFYSYGEIFSPKSGICDLQNESATVTTLWERP